MKNKKSLGQHWLKNRAILEEIAALAAGVTSVIGGMDFDGLDVLATLTGNSEDFVTGVGEMTDGVENDENGGAKGKKSPERGVGGALKPLCLEIGPGLGTLTSSLLRRFRKVVAVEFDVALAAKLPGQFPGKNLEVVNEDILKFDFARLEKEQESKNLAQQGSEDSAKQRLQNSSAKLGSQDLDKPGSEDRFKRGDFVVVGNIPYYITSPIIEKLLNLEVAPQRIVLLVQKEVAERVASEKETLLSLMVKNRAEVALGPVVSREEFTPPPRVDSEVLVLTPHAPEVGPEVLRLAKIGFLSPRKKLVHNLAGVAIECDAGDLGRVRNVAKNEPKHGLKMSEQGGKAAKKVLSEQEVKMLLTEAGIDENVRPGDLHLEDWAKLYNVLYP